MVTTDDDSPEYTAELAAQGWYKVDHVQLGTREKYGPWMPGLVDGVVLSLGKGFVGVQKSTKSALAARRVEDWNAGLAELVPRY